MEAASAVAGTWTGNRCPGARCDLHTTDCSFSCDRALEAVDDAPIRVRHVVMATGCLSVPKALDVPGAERFKGPAGRTSRWPHQGVDVTGLRVSVIGTSASGSQAIPLIAEPARQRTVFQRTPNFSMPAGIGPVRPEKLAPLQADRKAYREAARCTRTGVPAPVAGWCASSPPAASPIPAWPTPTRWPRRVGRLCRLRRSRRSR